MLIKFGNADEIRLPIRRCGLDQARPFLGGVIGFCGCNLRQGPGYEVEVFLTLFACTRCIALAPEPGLQGAMGDFVGLMPHDR
jgi:hypothetical protein